MLTPLQQRVVEAISRGAVDYADVAEEIELDHHAGGISRAYIRRTVRALCRRYGVSMQDLPAAVERDAATV